MKKKLCLCIAFVLIITVFSACGKIKPSDFKGQDYTIPELDLSVKPVLLPEQFSYLYDLVTVADDADYLAHPDSVLLKNGNILTMFPQGHGKGAVQTRISTDGGKSWNLSLQNTPVSWENSLETPTVYRLQFTDGATADKLVMISANPKWPGMSTNGGFNCSVSTDEGITWTEFETFWDKDSDTPVVPIVAMASLTQLKENGKFVDKWMGFFHDADFYNYKSILSFDNEGNPQWSAPEKYFSAYRKIEKKAKMCEVEVIRSEGGQGDELCLLARSNSKKMNALISFSDDEGMTWTKPKEAPAALNGERHKAEWTQDGRLFITFRSIERGQTAATNIDAGTKKAWLSEGWVAWVGDYDDLKNGTEGQYRIKLAHTYIDGQTQPQYSANADTGYCGNVVLDDGAIVTSSYGKFSPDQKTADGKSYKTYICSKRIKLADTDELIALLNP
ncbi:MAG: exo-alpha-sialidase [Clostridia bacterium]|nr:exo-alpha-sialidase [Clostridia bacterium]